MSDDVEAAMGHLTGVDDLTDLADLAWFEVDGDRNLVAVSPALERLTGFQAQDVLGKHCLSLIRCQQCLRGCGVFEQGVVEDVPLSLYRSDGSRVDVTKSGRTFVDEEGEIRGAIEVVLPRVADSEAGAFSDSVDALLDGLGRCLIVVGPDFTIQSCSEQLSEWTGSSQDELRGMPLEQLLGEELFGEASHFRAALAGGDRKEGFRAYLRTRDGGAQPVSISVGPIKDPAHGAGASGYSGYSVMVRLDQPDQEIPSFEGMVARSPAMMRIFRTIDLLHENDSTVLVTGESGTGKELVARALHATSHRRDGPFVAVNCAAIPTELLESELFGHTRGAFTGAVRDRAGRFERAHGGTLFLDEIGDLQLALQAKLLRFLQEHTIERVGDNRTRKVDVRVIAATNSDLVQAVADRRFREDLYYRLRVVPIEVPPLRKRVEDLDPLVRHILVKLGRSQGRALRLSPPVRRVMLTYDWPGNIRELENALEYATAVCEGQTIHVSDLPTQVTGAAGDGPSTDLSRGPLAEPHGARAGARNSGPWVQTPMGSEARFSNPAESDVPWSGLSLREQRDAEKVFQALEAAHWRREEAARRLGVSRTTLWRKMKQYRI